MTTAVTVVEASAPGKLVLVGEYAVLEGGTAISAAVDERAIARIGPAESDSCELHINNTGEKFAFSIGAKGLVQWHSQPGHLGVLLEIALQRLSARGLAVTSLEPFTVMLCTQDFYVSGSQATLTKTGTGSSAALAVALSAALQRCLEQEPVLDTCDDIHRSFQDGRGSGIDVVTSWHGGVVGIQKKGSGEKVLSQLEWLSGLQVLPVWTGIPASTPDMLDRFAEYRSQSPDAYHGLLDELCIVSSRALTCWRENDAVTFVACITDYAALLKKLDEAAQIGIWSDVHRQLETLATKCGAAYKPSGAGGGDYGLFFAASNVQLDELALQLGERESDYPAIAWTTRGLEVQTVAGPS